MSLKSIKSKQYEFSYIDIEYKNATVSPNIELHRWKKIKAIKYKIKTIFIKYGVEPFKGDLSSNIDNVIARVLFETYSNKKLTYLHDGLFNVCDNSTSLYNDLKTTFKINNHPIDETDCCEIIKEINLSETITKISEELNVLKKEKAPNIKIIKNKTFTVKIYNSTIITIPENVYTKLKRRYSEYKKANKKLVIPTIDDLLTCLLIRYNSLGSDGNQMGIPVKVKDRFQECNIDFEGFASALNHRYKYYCSMFYDIEKYFGSLGPFQNIVYTRGTYMLNPPYEKNLLNAMIHIMISSLKTSKKDLCFIFGTPTWANYKEVTFHNVINNSQFFKKKYVFRNYEVPWYNFLNNTYTKIPSSTRYIIANYYININCLNKTIEFWKKYKPI
jgi:hypothetical protein